MNWADLWMVSVLILGLPIYVALFRFPRLKRAVAAGLPHARLRAYREGMGMQWTLLILSLFIWLRTHPGDAFPRTLSELGLGFEGGLRWWIGLGATLALVVVLFLQRLQVFRDRENAEILKQQLAHVGPLLPHTQAELIGFKGLSLTAGICEEVLYRGFLMGVLIPFVGLWGAVGLSSLFFGLGHAYQGLKGILQTLAVGLILALLYALTRSLWLPMIVHGFLDWNSGVIAHHLLNPD